MSDYRCPAEGETEKLAFQDALSKMHFCRPGKILEFDPDSFLATVMPAIKAKVSDGKKVEYTDLPKIIRVPVVVPYSPVAGLCLTVPIREGDPCLLLFSDRFMDDFIDRFEQGGKAVNPEACGRDNLTTRVRMHHLTDAICIPGLYGQPDRIPGWNNDAIEMRTHDGKTYVRLGTGGYGIRLTSGVGFDAGGSDIRMQGGKIWFYGAEEISTRTREKWTEEPPTATGGTREPTMPD